MDRRFAPDPNEEDSIGALVRRALSWTPEQQAGVSAALEATPIPALQRWSERDLPTIRREVTGPVAGGLMAARDAAARPIRQLSSTLVSPFPESQARSLLQSTLEGPALAITAGADTETELPELTREAFREHAERGAANYGGVGQFLYEEATDPTTYIPFGGAGKALAKGGLKLATRGPVLRALGAGLQGLGKASIGYEAVSDAATRAVGRGISAGAQRIPVVGKLFQKSALSEATARMGEVGQAVQAAFRNETGAGETARAIMRPLQLRRARGKAVWPQVGGEMSDLQAEAEGLTGAARQLLATRILREVVDRKNALEVETEGLIRQTLRDVGASAGPPGSTPLAASLTKEEGDRIVGEAWNRQADGVLAVIRAGKESLEEIKAANYQPLVGVDEAAISTEFGQMMQTIRNGAQEARDIAAKLRGREPFEGEAVFPYPGATDVEELLAAESRGYRTARQATASTLDSFRQKVEGVISGATNQQTRELMEGSLAFYRQRAGDLTALSRPLHQRAIAASAEQRALLATEDVTVNAAYEAVERDEQFVRGLAIPLVRDDIRANNIGISLTDLEDQLEDVFKDTDSLRNRLAEMVRGQRLAAQTAKKITDRLDKYYGPKRQVGDLLRDEHWFTLMMDTWGRREAASRGEEAPSALAAAYFSAVGLWRDTALLSPRFTFNNMAWMLWAAHMEGYSAAPIALAWMRNAQDIAAQVATHPTTGARLGPVDLVRRVLEAPNVTIKYAADTSPAQKDWGLREGPSGAYLSTDPRQQTQIQSGITTAGPQDRGSALAGRNAMTAAVGGTAAGLVGYSLPADTQEERLQRGAIGAGVGGAIGGVLPTLIWANRLLRQVVESGGRLAVQEEAMVRAMAGREKQLLQFIGANAVVSQETIQKRITRRGREVTGIADLLGAQFTTPGPGGGTLFGGAPPGASQIATPANPGGLSVAMGDPATYLNRPAPIQALQAVEDFVTARGDRFSPHELRRVALENGTPVELADEWADEWTRHIQEVRDIGLEASNLVNYNYADVSNLTEQARRLGVFPFITFPVKAAPQVAKWMIQDPRLFIAMDRLNNISKEEIAEAGLPAKFQRLTSTGDLGDRLAKFALGREDATLLAQWWSMFVPFAELGREARPAIGRDESEARPLEQITDTLGSLGASLGPVPQLVGRLTGAMPDFGGSLLRTSPYIEAATTAAGAGAGVRGGTAINPELPVQGLIRGIRQGITGEETATVTGDVLKDFAIRQRIAEMAVQKTGRPPTGDYKRAMDDPKSAIWRRAQAEVERQRAGQTTLAATVPFRTRALTDVEQTVAASRKRERITDVDLAAMTPERDTRARGAAYARRSPSTALWGLGGDPEAIGWRQYDEYKRQTKRWQGMDPRRRASARSEYLKDKPYLVRILNSFG